MKQDRQRTSTRSGREGRDDRVEPNPSLGELESELRARKLFEGQSVPLAPLNRGQLSGCCLVVLSLSFPHGHLSVPYCVLCTSPSAIPGITSEAQTPVASAHNRIRWQKATGHGSPLSYNGQKEECEQNPWGRAGEPGREQGVVTCMRTLGHAFVHETILPVVLELENNLVLLGKGKESELYDPADFIAVNAQESNHEQAPFKAAGEENMARCGISCGCHGSLFQGESNCFSRDRLHLRRTTEQHVPEVEVQVKRRRTASLSNQECQLYPRRSQQQQIPVVDFRAELRQAFLAETPRGG
ncbi:hypothetical protein MC885_002277 [Smutsia gigantea]|nr:hypothetical protein MC885_002277 [Smutsia gigantea]